MCIRDRDSPSSVVKLHFIGQLVVSVGSFGAFVKIKYRLPIAGRLGKTHVAGNDSGVHLAGKISFDLLHHLLGQVKDVYKRQVYIEIDW